MPLSRSHLLLATVAGLAVGAPAAQAADSFVAITGGDRLVHLTSDTIPGLSRASTITGLPSGERLIALDARPSGELLALGTSGTLFGLDGRAHEITRTVGRLGARVAAGTPVTLSAAADGGTARVIAAGRDRTVDLATGAVVRDEAAPAQVAVDLGADGVLRGVDPAGNAVVTLDAGGEHVVAGLGLKTHGPTAVTTAADGSSWITTGLAPRAHGPAQSRLLRFDPVTGRLGSHDAFLPIQLDAIAATGVAPDDRTPPRVSVRVPRQTVRDALARHGFVALVTTSEPGQTLMSARIGSSSRSFGLATAEHAGRLRVLAYADRTTIRKAAGRRIRLHIAVHDYAGHIKLVDRFFTLGG